MAFMKSKSIKASYLVKALNFNPSPIPNWGFLESNFWCDVTLTSAQHTLKIWAALEKDLLSHVEKRHQDPSSDNCPDAPCILSNYSHLTIQHKPGHHWHHLELQASSQLYLAIQSRPGLELLCPQCLGLLQWPDLHLSFIL